MLMDRPVFVYVCVHMTVLEKFANCLLCRDGSWAFVYSQEDITYLLDPNTGNF